MTLSNSVKQPQTSANARGAATTETAPSEVIARLQRGVLRLALSYHGLSPELDRKLKEFGTLIRGGGRQSDRQRLIDEIVDTVVGLGLKHNVAQEPPASSGDSGQLTHFLECLAVPPTLRPEIQNTQRALVSARDRAQALEHIERAAKTLSEHLMQSPQSCTDAPAIRMLLIELLERLPVSDNLVSRLGPVRRSIEGAERVDAFLECTNSIAALMNELRQELQQQMDELAQYLRATAERLREFDEFVNRSRALHNDVSADALQLSDTVASEIEILRGDASAATDIVKLRETVNKRLDNIGSGLNSFVNAQNERSDEANQALSSMTDKLNNLEEQTQILRADLEQQHARVLIDPLTGALNRSGYLESATKQFARWKRYGGALSLAVIDIDLFKNVNDHYGHSAGDRVLATVAAQLQAVIRDSDILARYGGEEFALILPETNIEDAFNLVDKLRSHIETCPFRHKETPVNITMSCGVAQFGASDTLDDVFERADKAMYAAKSAGRNRACVDATSDFVAEPMAASA